MSGALLPSRGRKSTGRKYGHVTRVEKESSYIAVVGIEKKMQWYRNEGLWMRDSY